MQAFMLVNDGIQRFFFPSKLQSALGVAPDIGLFELGVYLLKTVTFDIEVKDTPLALARGEPGQ